MMAETFHGYIETTQDVLLIFEGCRRGLLPRICRRLQERERNLIRSGSIFVFDERESGIKRWTDGRVWSPSRILGNFLIYRELDKKIAGDRRLSSSSGGGGSSNNNTGRSFSLDGSIDRQKEKQLIGSLSDSYKFKEDGLIKKTMSISVNGVAQHLISYYNPKEVIENRLRLPSTVPELASLEISPELLVKQNFRVPPLVEPSFDQNECDMDSRHHAYRSMSVGSIRGPPPDLPVYPSFPRLDMERSLYGQSMSPNIPSNITPSPSTPMIPQRPPYHHQRHYSTSSTYRSDAEPQPENMYTDNTRHEERLATPNLVQLLNPIHPLNSNTMEYTYPYNKQEMHYNTYEKQSIKSEQENYPYEKQAAMNYMSYQPGHPLNNSVENLMFQNNSSFPQQQESTNMGPLINGLKKVLGLGNDKIGFIFSITPFVSSIAFPYWTSLVDKTGDYKKIMIRNMLIALLCTLSIGLVPFLSQTEWIKIALTSIGCFGYAFFGYPVIAALVDTVVLRVLADQKDLYGRQKIGVPIGFASSVFLTGLLVETLDSLYALFIVFSFCNLAFVITIWFTNFDPQYAVIKDVQYGSVTPEEEEEEDKDSEEQQSILVLLQDPEAVKFFAYMATMGFSIAVVQAFLYLYMENELHAKPAWVGLLGPLGSIPEVICFYFSKQILHMLGAKYMLIAGQSILLYRCLTYIVCLRLSFGVWLAIATQLLHGIGFSMTWSAGALQADSIAPQGLKSRSQGLLNTAFNGIGAGLGALLGGYVYEHLGAEAMWTMVAIISFFSIVLYASSFATRFLFKPLSKLWSHTPRS